MELTLITLSISSCIPFKCLDISLAVGQTGQSGMTYGGGYGQYTQPQGKNMSCKQYVCVCICNFMRCFAIVHWQIRQYGLFMHHAVISDMLWTM